MRLFFLSLIFLAQASLAQIPLLDNKKEITEFLDDWHVAAAEANAEAYFGSIASSGVFLGTDPTERWTKEQFQEYAKEAFANNRTWDFKPQKRFISFNDDFSIAWFDETLDTWMGPCRGSGVIQKISGEWKIRQYNLAVTVNNDLMTDYIKLIGK
ncbi:MAG: nuclear transport factor 2 family protein [Cyclobacteriaceae bacterium]